MQISDTQIIGTRVINETHFQLLREDGNHTALNLQPTISVAGAFTGGGNNDGNGQGRSNHYELQNYTSIALPKHFIKFGVRLRVATDTDIATSGFNGSFSFASLSDYVAGTPNQFAFTVGTPAASVTTEDTGLYIEDDWKARPNFTFSYGLRFETQNHISDHFDWAPRLGIAWGIGKSKTSPKTVLRAGAGVFYDRFGEGEVLLAARQGVNNPLQRQFVLSSNLANIYTECSTSLSAPGCQASITTGGASSTAPTFYQIAPICTPPTRSRRPSASSGN